MAGKITSEEFRFKYVLNGDDAQQELHKLERTTKELSASTKQARIEKSRLEKEGKKGTAEYKKWSQVITDNNLKLKENESRMSQLRKEIGITSLTMRQLRAESRKLKLTMDNMTPGSAQYVALEARLKAVDTRMRELRGSARATGSSLSRVADGFNKYSAIGLGVIAMLTGVVFQLQQVIDFNGKMSESMSDVQKTTGMTKTEVDDLSKSFGLLKTRTSRINLLSIAEQGGRIGIAKDEIAAFVGIMDKAVVALGDEFPGGASETAKSLGTLKGLFKETKDLGVDQAYNSIGSAINELGANGLASAPNLANFTKRVGAMPEALRPAIAEALGLGAAFEESGLEAEQSARAYSIFMTAASKDVEKFANVMGISVTDVKEMINTDPTGFFLEFSQGLDGMDATDTAKTLDYLGLSADGVKKIIGSAASNTQLFRDKMELANQSMLDGTSLIDEYNIKNNNFQATLDKVGKSIRGAFISDTFVNFLEGAVSWFAKFIGAADDSGSSALYLRKTLVFLIKVALVAGTAFFSYTAAVKLATAWQGRAALQTKLLTIAQNAQAISVGILKGAIYLLQIGYYRLTGQMARARGAMVAFTLATNMTPLAALLGLIAAIGVAYVVFSDAAKKAKTEQDYLNQAMDEATKKTAGQEAKIRALDKIVRDETKSEIQRKNAIKELNKIVPNYNADLDLTTAALGRSKIALDQHVFSLKKQIQAQSLANLMTAKAEELQNAKQASAVDDLAWYEKALQTTSGLAFTGFIDKTANQRKNQRINSLTDEMEALEKAYENFVLNESSEKSPLEIQLHNLRAARDDFKKGTKEYLEYQKQIDALTKKFRVVGGDDTGDGGKIKKQPDYLKELQAQRYKAAEDRVSLIKDASERERALEEISHAKKVEDLRDSLIKTDKLRGDALKNALDHNIQVNDRIELENKTHQLRLGNIMAQGMQDDLVTMQQGHASELRALKINQDKELTVFEGTHLEKKTLQDQHRLEELQAQERHATELKTQLQAFFQAQDFEGIDLDLLSDENRAKMFDQIDELVAKLAELGLAKKGVTGDQVEDLEGGFKAGSFGTGEADGVDILGFSISDYETLWANLDTTQGQIMGVGMALGALGSIYSTYSDMLTRQEDRDMALFTQNQERKKESLDRRLDRGFINQRQYNKATEALEKDAQKKQAKLEYERAKREKIVAIGGIIQNGALAISKAYAASPTTLGLPWSAIIAGQTALQLGVVAATPLPAKGYEDGMYENIMREQDGRMYRARNGGSATSQEVTSPTFFNTPSGRILTGENSTLTRPEVIIDSGAFARFPDDFKQTLRRQISIARGYQDGMYNESMTAKPVFNNDSDSSSGQASPVQSLTLQFLKHLAENGVVARISKDMLDIQDLQEELDRYNNLKKQNRV